jgi:GT2 family glycosyltransferase
METSIELSVVIPTYNGLSLLRDCIPSLKNAMRRGQGEGGAEILVVDDCSTDGTREFLQQEHPDVVVLSTPVNSGFAVAVNTGLKAARGTWISVINNDVVLDEQWLHAARRHFSREKAGAIASRIVRFDRPEEVESAGDEYTVAGIPLQYGNCRWGDVAAESRVCFSACGASAFYRRQALEDVGLFYEHLGAYYEDVELGFRLNLRGWDCVYEPLSVCPHRGSASYGRGSFRQKFHAGRNSEIVFYTCMPRRLLARYFLTHALAVFLHLGLHILRGTAWAFFCGKWSFLSDLPEVLRRRQFVQAMRTSAPADILEKMDRRWFRSLVLRRWQSR